MKVALVGDVHANLPALEAVLAEARSQAVEAIWNLGDFLGYGPFPEEVVARLRAEAAVSILGNYDAKVLKFERKQQKWRITKAAQKYLAFRWAHERLSEASRRYLRSLPADFLVEVDGLRVLLTHGSPAAVDEAVGPDTPGRRLEQLARMANADLVACGHTHRPLERRAAGVRFVNPGSVGRPEGGDPRACWAVLEIGPGRLAIHHRRTEYDVERTAEAIRAAGLPEDFAEMLRQGKNLRDVQLGRSAAAGPGRLVDRRAL